MSLHTDPLHPSVHRPPSSCVPPDADERLLTVARSLHDVAADHPGPTDLMGVVDQAALGVAADPGGRPDHLVLVALDDLDPVGLLLGRSAPAEFWAIGVVTGARVQLLDGADGDDGAAFVHLVDRRGVAVDVRSTSGGEVLVDGPSAEPVQGRMPDALRRMLGLPSAPPPPDMTAHVVDLWLARVTREALVHPGLDWASVVARNPAHELLGPCTTVPTPAVTARHILELGEQLDWDRYRLRCVEAGGTPFGELDGDIADWMDAGMFARWMLGESMPWPAHLDLLEALLSPGAVDRLRATLAMCPPPTGAPTRRRPVVGELPITPR